MNDPRTIRLLVAPLNIEEEEQAAMFVVGELDAINDLKASAIAYRIDGNSWTQAAPYVDVTFDNAQDATAFRSSVEARGFDQVIRCIVD